MGFFKFSGKKEAEENKLDVPPMPPPSLKDQEHKLPGFKEIPPIKVSAQKPLSEIPMPEPQGIEEKPFPSFEKKQPRHKLPEFQTFEEKPRPMPSFKPQRPRIKPEFSFESMEKEAVKEEKELLRHKVIKKHPTYLRIDRFKEILKGISIVKSDLKKSNDSLIRANEIKEKNDRVFEKWRDDMEDVQKKLIFIDKTLFKGE